MYMVVLTFFISIIAGVITNFISYVIEKKFGNKNED